MPMSWLLLSLLSGAVFPLLAQHTAYACAATTKEYVVGAKLAPSGVFRRTPNGEWQHIGFNHPFTAALDYDRRDVSLLYLAAGNGLIRLADRGEKWTILTGNDATELSDLAVDPNAPGTIYFTHTMGIRVTHDSGRTWRDASAGLKRK